ncbi:hypothetical protein [Pelosinus sp. IPA-1]|uniref:hypothetical protein n=1 Tax=Pelosinus sp. IPA-1 TaxID=3029569 RepID=UPI0024362581|nr:hypothetical protein [Pelosinus sp. IPA-1]GMA98797.1 hypothetical protein PIPA1_15970 [Pelosinus sp. IPA-1]
MSLDVVGISLSPQSKSSIDQNDKNGAKENTKSKNQSKYVTETEGNYEYTYVVIGDFKILVGRVPKDEDKDKDKDEKKTGDATDKKNVHTMSNNVQTLMGYQQSITAALPRNNPQEKIQAMEKYAENPYYDIAKVNAKG